MITPIRKIPIFTSKLSTSIARAFPDMTVKSTKALNALNWIDNKISSPQNRLILGVTALLMQPLIDMSNKKVDEDTRKYSAVRTVAKIIAGTATGFLIRYGCIKAISKCSLLPEVAKNMKYPKLRTLFTPPQLKNIKNPSKVNLSYYRNALGTVMSLFIMMFSNFLIDAPLTKYLTNKGIDIFKLPFNDNKNNTNKKEVKNG